MGKFKKVLKDLDFIENEDDNDLVLNLLTIPKKDKSYEQANVFVPTANFINEIDLLFLPVDNTTIKGSEKRVKEEFKKMNAIRKANKQEPFKNDLGYRYLVVCIDPATHIIDAEPIKYKYSFIVRDAVKRIYARKILKVPHEIHVDAGNEFRDEFSEYFNKVSHIRKKKAGRHRAQAVVEGVNSLISKVIQTRMLNEEIKTKQKSVEWIEFLPQIVIAINKHYSHKPPTIDEKEHTPIKCKKNTQSCDLLLEGTRVRIQLDNPVDAVETKRLNGKFRIADIRWENKIKHVTQIYLRPDFPPMYEIDNDDNVAYTRKQLQVVKENEKAPTSKTQVKTVIKDLLERVKVKNKIYFKVFWEDDDITLEPRVELYKTVPGLIDEFEEILKLAPKISDIYTKGKTEYFTIKYKNGKTETFTKNQLNKRFPTVLESYDMNKK
jgi:hypothetical protein